MWQIVWIVLAVATASLTLADEPLDKELAALQGQWVWVRHEVGGKRMAPDANERPLIKIEGTKWSFKNKNDREFQEAGTFQLDVSTMPDASISSAHKRKRKGRRTRRSTSSKRTSLPSSSI